MNVLAIGNSFSQDATRYLHGIARADGEDIRCANLYIGGCSLERHFRNMHTGSPAYELEYNGWSTGFFVSLSEALLSRAWDVVTLQQVSSQSFKAESFEPYIAELASYVRRLSPKAKIFVHETWAYERGSERLLKMGFDSPFDMLAGIIDSYKEAASDINADGFIPSGELFGMLLENGVTELHRDTYHATRGIGRYALGLLWYRMLTDKSVLLNPFDDLDEPVPEDAARIIRECVETF